MDEKKFRELLLENNQLTEQRTKELLVENIRLSEERQNGKLAYMEETYGTKISAIFDKIVSMEEILTDNKSRNVKNENKIEKHDDILFTHDLRIKHLENKVSSL